MRHSEPAADRTSDVEPATAALGVAAKRADLYREAERLTERFRARLAQDANADGEEFVRRREAILERIEALGMPPADAPGDADQLERYATESAAAVSRMIELNNELVAMIEAEKTRVRHRLAEIGRSRQSLASYQGPMPLSPSYYDRRG